MYVLYSESCVLNHLRRRICPCLVFRTPFRNGRLNSLGRERDTLLRRYILIRGCGHFVRGVNRLTINLNQSAITADKTNKYIRDFRTILHSNYMDPWKILHCKRQDFYKPFYLLTSKYSLSWDIVMVLELLQQLR